jgi:2-(1,2-epoxy-1,2-dihydrophenyl)acetyl-CoA isomerase
MSEQQERQRAVVWSVEDGIASLVLNRPEVLNALNGELIRDMRAALRELRARSDVRVLVITGRGRGFCAGADLRDTVIGSTVSAAERGQRFMAVMDEDFNAMFRELYAFDRPKIAAINGPAVGGGTSLALTADIAIAARSAYFAQTFTPLLGLIPDLGCGWQLVHRIGRARAVALCMLGDRLPAETAAEWGLIWRAVDDEQLMPEVMQVARKLRDGPPRALAVLPRALDLALTNDFGSYLDLERDLQRALVESDDFAQAIAAFRAKKPPVFEGK